MGCELPALPWVRRPCLADWGRIDRGLGGHRWGVLGVGARSYHSYRPTHPLPNHTQNNLTNPLDTLLHVV